MVDFVPDQAPDAVQLDADVDDQVMVTYEFTSADVEDELRLIVIVGVLDPPPETGLSEDPPPPPPPHEMTKKSKLKVKKNDLNLNVYILILKI